MSTSKTDGMLLSILAHGSSLFTSFVVSILVPIIILASSEDETVKENAREAINFQINLIIWALISLAACIILVGFAMLFVLAAWSFIVPIIAMVRVLNAPEKPHRYSLILVRVV